MPRICYTPKNFSSASLRKIHLINGIISEYTAQGFDLTLRQLYYQMVSRDYIANNVREYKNLGVLVSDARLAGYIDWNSIVDRVRNLQRVPTWDDPSDIISSAAYSYRTDLWEDQDYRIEVWIEKNALIGVIDPICRELRVPFFACVGYTSQSEMWGAAQRIRGYIENDQIPIILHLGDHDPSGQDMTRDIQDRLDLFLSVDLAQRGQSYQGLEVDRLALNMDQIEQYNPPPNPTKFTDSRATAYIAEFGYDSWELDALDPTTIADIIEAAVMRYRDENKWQVNEAIEEEDRDLLAKTSDNWSEVTEFLSSLDD